MGLLVRVDSGERTSWMPPILSPDQQFQAGLFCGVGPCHPDHSHQPQFHLPRVAIRLHAPEDTGARTENDDTNPPRVSPRNLFDLAFGDDDLFHGDRYKWSAASPSSI